MKKIFYTCLFLAVISLTGCNLLKPGSSPKPGDTVTSENMTDNEHLKKFFEAFQAVTAYRATIETPDASAGGSLVMEVQPPDLTHTIITTKDGTIETIYTPTASYFKQADRDTWLKMAIEQDSGVEDYKYSVEDFEQEFMSDDSYQVTYLGTQPCGDLTCHAYQSSYQEEGVSTIFFDTDEYLLRKIEAGNDDQLTTLTYEYGDISIEIPTNVESFDLPSITALDDLDSLEDLNLPNMQP